MQDGSKKLKLNKLDNISVTAFRIITILNMLLESSCNDDQINDKLKEDIEGARSLSKDTICIYLNTLRFLGCGIPRPSKKNNFKYFLKSHPFKISVSDNEIQTLVEIRKYISLLGEWKTALEIDRVFDILLPYLTPEAKEFFSSLKKSTLSREVDMQNFFHEIKQFEIYCLQNKILTLVYDSGESQNKNITLKAEKIVMENGAYYLCGYNKELETDMHLRIDKIVDIKTVSLYKSDIKPKSIVVRYKLTGCCPFSCRIQENESIVERTDKEIIIEAIVTNKFSFFQKILSYGNKCTIIAPDEFRKELMEKLDKMHQMYAECV